jgi:hypothetical protein
MMRDGSVPGAIEPGLRCACCRASPDRRRNDGGAPRPGSRALARRRGPSRGRLREDRDRHRGARRPARRPRPSKRRITRGWSRPPAFFA